MILIISPAKSMNMNKIDLPIETTTPQFMSETDKILSECKKFSKNEIAKLMGISDKLAELNYERFQEFENQDEKAALFAFDGDVYNNINKDSYSKEELEFTAKHLRILSGLYGILRPFDLIRPYRLEMGKKLKRTAPKGLSAFWREKVTAILKSELESHKQNVLVNLASNEYADSVDFDYTKLGAYWVNIHFRERRNGELKNIALNSKRARGMMVDYIAKNQIDNVEDLKKFDYGGYRFAGSPLDEDDYLFIR